MSRYIRAQLILGLMVGLTVGIGLSILGVQLSIGLGVWAGVTEMIPIIGPLVASGIGILIALGHDPGIALWAVVFFILLEMAENYILVPKVLGHSVRLHPFWVIVSLLTGRTPAFGIGAGESA